MSATTKPPVFRQLRDVFGEFGRLCMAGAIFPNAMRRKLDEEEMDAKLKVVCGEHYGVALRWVAWRQQWHPVERDWLNAARDEFEHAIRYGPHTVPPHPDKMSQA